MATLRSPQLHNLCLPSTGVCTTALSFSPSSAPAFASPPALSSPTQVIEICPGCCSEMRGHWSPGTRRLTRLPFLRLLSAARHRHLGRHTGECQLYLHVPAEHPLGGCTGCVR